VRLFIDGLYEQNIQLNGQEFLIHLILSDYVANLVSLNLCLNPFLLNPIAAGEDDLVKSFL
jgi:hypothetical protein